MVFEKLYIRINKLIIFVLIFFIYPSLLNSQSWVQTNGPNFMVSVWDIFHYDSILITKGYPESYSSDDKDIYWTPIDFPGNYYFILFNDTFVSKGTTINKWLSYINGQFGLNPYYTNPSSTIVVDTVGSFLIGRKYEGIASTGFWVSSDGHDYTNQVNGLPLDSIPVPPDYNTYWMAVNITDQACISDKVFITKRSGMYVATLGVFDWTELTNAPNYVYRFFEYKDILFAIAYDGIYKSYDLGINWIMSFPYSNHETGHIVEFHDTLYYNYDYKELYYSHDNGDSWNIVPEFINCEVNGIFSFDSSLFVSSCKSLWRHNGIDWEVSDMGVFTRSIYINSNDSAIVCSDVRMYNSLNSGNKWTFISEPQCRFGNIATIADTFYTSFCNINYDLGISKSVDNGLTWDTIHTDFVSYGSCYYIVTNSIDRILMKSYSRMYRSDDFGLGFNEISFPSSNLITFIPFYLNSNIFIPCSDYYYNIKLLRSFDNGSNWDIVDCSKVDTITGSIGTWNNLFFMGYNESGIYKTNNYGYSWTPCNNGLPAGSTANCFYDYNGNLFVSIKLKESSVFNKVYFSNDLGLNWQDISQGLDSNLNVYNKTIFNNCLYMATTNGVWKRELNDINLSIANIDNPDNLINIFPNPSDGLFSVTSQNSKIEKVEILNINGIQVKSISDTDNNVDADISELSPGVYFVRICIGANVFNRKLLLIK